MSEDKAELFAYYWRLLAPAGLPAPEREYLFAKHLGRKFLADFCWPDARRIVEIDGGQFAFRGGRHSTDADRDKLNIAANLGYVVYHFSPTQLEADPESCIKIVTDQLPRR